VRLHSAKLLHIPRDAAHGERLDQLDQGNSSGTSIRLSRGLICCSLR
jgi:hypothetical protein